MAPVPARRIVAGATFYVQKANTGLRACALGPKVGASVQRGDNWETAVFSLRMDGLSYGLP